MSQKNDKKLRRGIRKIVGHAYEESFKRQGERDAKVAIMSKSVKPKPHWIPQFVWARIVNRVLRSPDEIAFRK